MSPYRDNPDQPSEDRGSFVDAEHRAEALQAGQQKVQRLWDGFLDFAFQGNILEIAFGLMSALPLPFRILPSVAGALETLRISRT